MAPRWTQLDLDRLSQEVFPWPMDDKRPAHQAIGVHFLRLEQLLFEFDQDAHQIESDPNLSDRGRASKLAKKATDLIANSFAPDACYTLESVNKAVNARLEKLEAELGVIPNTASDQRAELRAREIREHFKTVPQKDRFALVSKLVGHPEVAAAVLHAPYFLSGLTEQEHGFVRENIQKVLHANEVTEKELLIKGQHSAEMARRRAITMVTTRAKLIKDAAGNWYHPAAVVA